MSLMSRIHPTKPVTDSQKKMSKLHKKHRKFVDKLHKKDPDKAGDKAIEYDISHAGEHITSAMRHGAMESKHKNWMQAVKSKMQSKGTVGSFSKSAKNSGESTENYATKVLSPNSGFSGKMKKRAALAKTFAKFRKK